MIEYAFPLAVSALASAALTPPARRLAFRLGAIDRPGGTKIHTGEIPRLGGVAVVGGAALGLALALALGPVVGLASRLDPRLWTPVAAGSALVFALGVWDDVRARPPFAKLAVQSLAAAVAVAFGARIEHVTFFGTTYALGALTVPVTVAWVVGLTNAFNLIDGLDGLATGIAAIASATGAAICALRGDAEGVLVFVAVLGAALGFLPFNLSPARIFLGDSGSLTLGFSLALLSILRWQKGATTLAVLVPLLVFALPLADATLSIVRRSVSSQRPLDRSGGSIGDRVRRLRRIVEPDTDHIHHRLLRVGLSRRDAVLLLYGTSVCLSLLALFMASDAR